MGRICTFVNPHVQSFVIVFENGEPQQFRVEAVTTLILRKGQNLPCIVDCFFLEIITEGEVSQHLEESTVTSSLAHFIDIEGAHALLHAGHASLRWSLLTQKVGNERHHTGDGEQRCGIRRNERCRWCNQMVMVAEVVKISPGDLRRLHARNLPL